MLFQTSMLSFFSAEHKKRYFEECWGSKKYWTPLTLSTRVNKTPPISSFGVYRRRPDRFRMKLVINKTIHGDRISILGCTVDFQNIS